MDYLVILVGLWTTWPLQATGYNIKTGSNLDMMTLPDSVKSTNTSLFGYSVALTPERAYVGAPGLDKGKGAVFECPGFSHCKRVVRGTLIFNHP